MNRERTAELEAQYLKEHPGTAGTVEPFVFSDLEDQIKLAKGEGRFPFPVITEHLLSEDWEPTGKEWFVDSSGFGRNGEPAMTMSAFREQLRAYVDKHLDHGFGISGVGQFQVHVSAYRRAEWDVGI